ncbi:transporter substrate-binding domain-containing protein [Vibrio sp.]|nr:transporter substrate-binding domain-containing protein [Vibrio sp.]
MLKRSFVLLLSLVSMWARADLLTDIQERGYIRVGTTADYKPFSYYDGKNFSGYDIDIAKYFSKELNVEVRFVQTSWKELVPDLEAGKYDIAMGGITRRTSRQLAAEQTQGYMTFGKLFLAKAGHGSSYDSLEKVNLPKIKVGVNIGGTNEKFAEQYLPNATLVKFENNLDVPKAVIAGDVDVMVTETPEALFYQTTNSALEAVRKDNPFTKSQFGYLIPKGEQRLLNTINFLMDELKLKGIDKELMHKNQLM